MKYVFCTMFYNGFVLKISICMIMPGFCKSSHKCIGQITLNIKWCFQLGLAFLHPGCFCIAYQYFWWVVSVTLPKYCSYIGYIFRWCDVTREQKSNSWCVILQCTFKIPAQDNIEMDWFVHEIKLETLIVSLSSSTSNIL